eukprot:1178768-Prorocentrum_minimum.AAC.1
MRRSRGVSTPVSGPREIPVCGGNVPVPSAAQERAESAGARMSRARERAVELGWVWLSWVGCVGLGAVGLGAVGLGAVGLGAVGCDWVGCKWVRLGTQVRPLVGLAESL